MRSGGDPESFSSSCERADLTLLQGEGPPGGVGEVGGQLQRRAGITVRSRPRPEARPSGTVSRWEFYTLSDKMLCVRPWARCRVRRGEQHLLIIKRLGLEGREM